MSVGRPPMPVLALVATPETADRVVPLLALVGIGVRVVSFHAPAPAGELVGPPDALLVTATSLLPGLPEVPTAVWLTDDEFDDDGGGGVAAHRDLAAHHVLLRWSSRAGGEGFDRDVIEVPAEGIDVARWPAMAPLVRQRWRTRLGLPDRLVLAVESGGRPSDVTTALALATAAVVPRPHVPLALALGTPTITDASTAADLGLRPGIDVEVAATDHDADRLAGRLANDPIWCARLSRCGRATAERRLDLGRPAGQIRQRLGLVAGGVAGGVAGLVAAGAAPPGPTNADRSALIPRLPADPVDSLLDRLAELTTPPGARIVDRAASAVAHLSARSGART